MPHLPGSDVHIIDDVVMRMTCGVREDSQPSTRRGIVIGCDTYMQMGRRDEGVQDCNKIAEVLSQLGFTVSKLYNEAATKIGIQREIKGIGKSGSQATIIFISSHCVEQSGVESIACYDTRGTDQMSYISISEMLRLSPGFFTTLVVDPSFATTLQRVTVLNFIRAAVSSVSEYDDCLTPVLPSSAQTVGTINSVSPAPVQASHQIKLPSVGLELVDFSSRGVNGVKVLAIRKNGPASLAGVSPGDVIVGLNSQPINDRTDFRRVLGTLINVASTTITISPASGGSMFSATMTLEYQ